MTDADRSFVMAVAGRVEPRASRGNAPSPLRCRSVAGPAAGQAMTAT